MRLVLLLLVALSLSVPAAAQDNETNATPNETPAANETPTNETPAEPAAPAGPLEITLETHTTGGGGYFTLQGETGRNPTLRAAPGQEVRVTIVGTDTGVHNFCVGQGQCSDFVSAPGMTATLTFTAPESGNLEYYCLPHRTAQPPMRGQVSTAAAPEPGAGGEQGEIAGETIDLGQYSPACQGRVAPAAAAEGIVGLPTLQDYIDACTQVEGEAGPAREKHAADYVIPLSWLLIGLGVVGVVWVHKYYKP